MNVWKTTSILQTPQLVLIDWKIYEVPDYKLATRHFVGYNVTEQEGRVSSAIQEFDPKTMRGRTNSNRIYLLEGPSGFNEDAEYVWDMWRKINKVSRHEDVTHDYT